MVLQRGSPESNEPHKAGPESDEEQKAGAYARPDSPRWAAAGGARQAWYSRSLGTLMCTLFLLSELPAVGSMAIFSVYLRQRGSPESKPVGSAHRSTGVEG